MKKVCLLILCLGLVACDNKTFTGKCLPNERDIATTTQNGKHIETKTTERYLCGCFENKESVLPDFGPEKEEFSFEITDKETTNDYDGAGGIEVYAHIEKTETVKVDWAESKAHAQKSCDKQCTKWCNKHKR